MPFLRFDIIEGRSDTEIAVLLNAAHAAMVEAFGVPGRDRYQVVQEHAPGHVRAEDTGLGITRSRKLVMLQVTSRARTTEAKQIFYQLLCKGLLQDCEIPPDDVIVSFVTNSDEDWSFGRGRAQLLTGELTA